MVALGYVGIGLGLGFAAAVQPGPFQAFVTTRALAHGWRGALPTAFAPLLSDAPVIVLVLVMLTRLPDAFVTALYFLGGTFVLYLAWASYRSCRRFEPQGSTPAGTAQRSLASAAAVNVLSPGPYLFWALAAGPVLLQAWSASGWHAAAFVSGFYGAMVASLALLIVLAGSARRLGPRAQRSLLFVSGLMLAAFGLAQLLRGAARL